MEDKLKSLFGKDYIEIIKHRDDHFKETHKKYIKNI